MLVNRQTDRQTHSSHHITLLSCLALTKYSVTEFLYARRYTSAELAMSLCLSVCVSVTRRSCVKTAKRIQLMFGTEAFLGLCYTAF